MGHSTSSALFKWPSLGPPNYDLLCIDLIVHKSSLFSLDPLLKDPPLYLSPVYNSPSLRPLHMLSFLRQLLSTSPMAATAGSLISMQSRPALGAATRISSLSAISLSSQGNSFLSFRLRPVPERLRISCAAKPETVEKVCSIVKKQLALADHITVSGESKFTQLGADSLDTVEIVMGLEEEFGISVEEESAQSIATVQDAAELIEKLVAKKST